jgi:hypothetical protein
VVMARVHGAINVVSGLWPLLHMRNFEWLFGPKVDRWLVTRSRGLTSVGYAQWRDGTDEDWPHARRIGVASSRRCSLLDLVNVPRGRIHATYLIDARVEATLLGGWLVTAEPVTQRSGRQR